MTRLAVFRLVMSNPRLRRVVIAFAAFNLADWARWLSVLIFAFTRGGAAEAGAVSLLQLLPAAFVAPLAASFGDRFRRDRVLVASYVAQAAFMVATALVILADGPAPLVYAFAILGACSITVTRPAHGALMPWLSRTPAELTAANAVSGTMEGLGILVGQAAAGAILQFTNPGVALLASASVAAIAALLALSVTVERPETAPARGVYPRVVPARGVYPGLRPERGVYPGLGPEAATETNVTASRRAQRALWKELTGGFRAVLELPGPRAIVSLLGLAAFVWGALDVLIVVLVFDLLHVGAGAAGILNALAGAGGLAGAAIALSLAGRIRLAVPFVVGLLAWGLPLAASGLLPLPLVVGGLLLLGGAGRTVMDVVGRTLLQRSAPDEVLTRVFGVVEGIFMGAFGLGSITTPVLLSLVGPQGAFVIVGLLLPLGALVAWRSLVNIDRTASVPVRELALLRSIPMFEHLAPSVLERLAGHLEPVTMPAGALVIREGDRGDRMFVLDSGEVEVTVSDYVVRRQGPGTEFGEIALLRDVPRTATVRAVTDVSLLALRADVFLAAVTGQVESRQAADAVIEERLAQGSR